MIIGTVSAIAGFFLLMSSSGRSMGYGALMFSGAISALLSLGVANGSQEANSTALFQMLAAGTLNFGGIIAAWYRKL